MASVTETPPSIARPRLWMLALGVAFVALVYLALNALFTQTAIRDTPNRAQFFASTIDDALLRLEHLPYVISIDPTALATLQNPEDQALNATLEDIAQRSGAEFIFLMDINGKTIASSNHRDENSLIGEFYTFRPYFQDAITGETGRFYAVGATTGKPGYFVAEPVRDAAGTIFGVVVVKIGVTDLTQAWADSGELVMVTNPQGVIIASSEPELTFSLTRPLSSLEMRELEERRQFDGHDLQLLDWNTTEPNRAVLNGTPFLWTTADVQAQDWTLHLLADLREIRTRAMLFVAIALAGILTLAIVASVFRSAQLKAALAVSDADRTRLTKEIEERRLAEARLLAAKTELARKDRLAALGSLSASITHELGQPISAMRNYLAAEEIATGSLPGELNPQLSGLVNRMQRIVDQLRSFGRVSSDDQREFDPKQAIEAAYALVHHDVQKNDITVSQHLDAGLLIKGSQAKLEQVIVNLLRNAIDAVEDAKKKQLGIRLEQQQSDAVITITDTGPGIGALDVTALQEPFYTTKASGRGMGLGLAISGQIMDEAGGRMEAENGAQGAIFRLILPLVEG